VIATSRPTRDEEEPTKIVARNPLRSVPDATPAATSKPPPGLPPIIQTHVIAKKSGLGRLAPLLWATLGAGLTAAAFTLYDARAPKAPVVTADVTQTAQPVARPQGADPDPVPAPAPDPVPAAVPDPVPAPTLAPPPSLTFDPQAIGDQILAAARPCFPDRSGGVVFGASVSFSKTDGKPRKTYYSAGDGLTPVERKCVTAAIQALAPSGSPPDKNVVVEYSFHVRPDGGEVKVRRSSP
jgi:hypothetical protein